MPRSVNNRALIAIAIVIAFVAIVVPTCRMVGCSMGTGGMSWGHVETPGFFGSCGGTYVTNDAPAAVVPAGADSLVLALVAVLMLAVLIAPPQLRVQQILAHSSDPPPPEDPRGERLRI